MELAPDGRTLAAGGWDGRPRLWALDARERDPGAEVARLEEALEMGLSAV